MIGISLLGAGQLRMCLCTHICSDVKATSCHLPVSALIAAVYLLQVLCPILHWALASSLHLKARHARAPAQPKALRLPSSTTSTQTHQRSYAQPTSAGKAGLLASRGINLSAPRLSRTPSSMPHSTPACASQQNRRQDWSPAPVQPPATPHAHRRSRVKSEQP